MTTLATGLPIDYSIDSKITPALRLSVQKATSAFQKDFCYDLIQAFVDEPEIANPIGIRLFLNFCLRKPELLVESWLDAIDQNVDTSDLTGSADSILNELDNFLEFVHGLIEIIEIGEVFKLAYHEIDAWNLCSKLLGPVQRRLYDLAIQDRDQVTAATLTAKSKQRSEEEEEDSSIPELTIGSHDSNSAFYQAFVSIDKFLKHTFDSRVLLEPAKLVDELTELEERRTDLATFRMNFPLAHSSTIIVKKFGRFGREETALNSFLNGDKFKELTKLKNSLSGAQLTRQPSTRVRKAVSTPVAPVDPTPPQPKPKKPKRSISNTPNQTTSTSKIPASSSSLATNSNHIDPFLVDVDASPPLGRKAFADAPPQSSPNSQRSIESPATSINPKSIDSSYQPSGSGKKIGRPRSSIAKRKRPHPPTNERDASINATKRGRKSRSTGKKTNDVFVIEKIIGESVDTKGEKIYRVLWAGYPETDATWQFANSLDDCAAVDVWEEQKRSEPSKEHNPDRDAEGEDDESLDVKSPAALVATTSSSTVMVENDKLDGQSNDANGKADNIDEKLDDVVGKVEDAVEKLDNVVEKVADVAQKVDDLNGKMNDLGGKTVDVNGGKTVDDGKDKMEDVNGKEKAKDLDGKENDKIEDVNGKVMVNENDIPV